MMVLDVAIGSRHYYERLDRLKKRRNWLWKRIYKAEKANKPLLTFDRAEASAIDWAIQIIEQLPFILDEMRNHDQKETSR